MITIFTPSYNRAYCLKQLYQSLCRQSYTDFEWILIDDGSTDETEELCKKIKSEGKLSMTYIKVANGGKHRAINMGVQIAKGELFFIIDSDDYITDDALQCVNDSYKQIRTCSDFAGISGNRIYKNGNRIGGEVNYTILDISPLKYRLEQHIIGDMAEIWKTSVLRKFPFPEIEGEKFCPEALIWNRISQNYKLRYFNKGIYVCDYLPDGLTAKIVRIRMQSCRTSMLYYSELVGYDINVMQKLKAAINYWRFRCCSKTKDNPKLATIWFWTFPIGLLLHINDLRH